MKAIAKNFANSLIRFARSLRRPSRRSNYRKLIRRGESLDAFTIREINANDLPGLARLHVLTWNETYANHTSAPGYELRVKQWGEQFNLPADSWFCYILENSKGDLIGFAKGKSTGAGSGVLDKIYLLRNYQKLGLGRKMFEMVVRRFLSMGITRMSLFGIPQNPSGYFHEAMGGTRLYAENGEFHGGYIWHNLNSLL